MTHHIDPALSEVVQRDDPQRPAVGLSARAEEDDAGAVHLQIDLGRVVRLLLLGDIQPAENLPRPATHQQHPTGLAGLAVCKSGAGKDFQLGVLLLSLIHI